MIIPINVSAQNSNQQVSFFANNQNFTLNLYWRGYINQPESQQEFINTYATPQFYADIYINNAPVVNGAPVINKQVINQYPNSMVGYIVAVDLLTGDNPSLTSLGVTSFLYYVDDLSEIERIS